MIQDIYLEDIISPNVDNNADRSDTNDIMTYYMSAHLNSEVRIYGRSEDFTINVLAVITTHLNGLCHIFIMAVRVIDTFIS